MGGARRSTQASWLLSTCPAAGLQLASHQEAPSCTRPGTMETTSPSLIPSVFSGHVQALVLPLGPPHGARSPGTVTDTSTKRRQRRGRCSGRGPAPRSAWGPSSRAGLDPREGHAQLPSGPAMHSGGRGPREDPGLGQPGLSPQQRADGHPTCRGPGQQAQPGCVLPPSSPGPVGPWAATCAGHVCPCVSASQFARAPMRGPVTAIHTWRLCVSRVLGLPPGSFRGQSVTKEELSTQRGVRVYGVRVCGRVLVHGGPPGPCPQSRAASTHLHLCTK